MSNPVEAISVCYHCGENCEGDSILFDKKKFCCTGCKTVYEILNNNGLCDYYTIENTPGKSRKKHTTNNRFGYLDDAAIQSRLINFTDGNITTVTLLVPAMHCSSCIWLLENLYKLNSGIVKSRVNFSRKEVKIVFNKNTTLRIVVELLARIGYEPELNMDTQVGNETKKFSKYYFKLGVAFFCFGNIMLLSFPEYFGISTLYESSYRRFFGYLNFCLSLPVLLYSGSEFFVSAYYGLKQKRLNMDFPIALGIIAMFLQSSYDIFWNTGAGYMDTLASLIFLMLIGRMFQQKTYDTISFERNYKSYFPISVNTIGDDGNEQNKSIDSLKIGDRLVVRNEEIVPADSILFSNETQIDYSFVTGESRPVKVLMGEIIYAGGRQLGSLVEMEVVKNVSQSYLTGLWNDEAFAKEKENNLTSLANKVSVYFTIIILLVATAAALYWMRDDWQRAVNAFTAVLIITCPCALALSSPFTFGNALRYLGAKKMFFKNGAAIEKLAAITTIVFDKTGTITQSREYTIAFNGEKLNQQKLEVIRLLAKQSSHPLSKKIYDFIKIGSKGVVNNFHEYPGKGIEGNFNNMQIKMGSAEFAASGVIADKNELSSRVYLNIDGVYQGFFSIKNNYRPGLNSIIDELSTSYKLILLSGDNEAEREYLKNVFKGKSRLLFNQTPADKLQFIKALQDTGEKVLMIGDGLNDAGALKQSDVGIAIADNANNFTPACDIIIDADNFNKLPWLIKYSKACVNIIKTSFLFSFLYNLVGIYFAVSGTLSPLIAAILMPVSSVTIILFTTTASFILIKKK